MLKFIATDVVVSKGFNNNPALRYSEDGSSVRFRIGKRVYDKRAQDNHRWINMNIKAFGDLCERIKKMKLDEGSFIHVEGRYDEDVWEDQTTHETNRAPVVILTEIEYAFSGNKQNGNSDNEASGSQWKSQNASAQNGQAAAPSQSQPEELPPEQGAMPDNFTGFESFGGANPFFPETK